jgi:AcrR family transcriptional regulator
MSDQVAKSGDPEARPARRMAPERRRAQLVQAALASGAEHGYAGLSLDDVGERAGVTRNLLYHYFPRGRLDLYLAALERAGDELTGDFIVAPEQPLAERLAANTERAIEHAGRASDA